MAADYSGMSTLEREIELEMDDELGRDEEGEEEQSYEQDEEAFEVDEESDIDEEGDFEDGVPEELETTDDGRHDEFVDRFMEISAREFESEAEVDQAMNQTLNEMATEYLFGKLWKKAKKFGKRLAKNKIVGSLVKKGLAVAQSQFPALKAALQLAKGDLQGALLNVGKQALGAAIPGGTAALGALQALGADPDAQPQEQRENWDRYVTFSREAFEHLADNVTEAAHQPLEASRLAAKSFQHAVRRAQARAGIGGAPTALRPAAGGVLARRRGDGRVTRYRVGPGEKIVITGGHKLIVRGV